MKAILMGLLFCGMILTAYSQETVKVGVFLHSPYVEAMADGKGAEGAGVSYMTAVLTDLGYQAKVIVLPFPRLIASLESGEVDMTFDLAKNPEREAFAFYSDRPTMVVKPVLFFRKDHPISSITSVNDLQGLRIGYLTGSTIPKAIDVPDVYKLDLMSGTDQAKTNLGKLIAKRIDAILDLNPYSYMIEAKKIGAQNQIKSIPLPGDGTEFFVLFSKKSKLGADLVAAFNKQAATGTFQYTRFIDELTK